MKFNIYASLLYHIKSKDKTQGGNIYIPQNYSDWPDSWKRIEYKLYHKLDKISLPKVTGVTQLNQLLFDRESKRASSGVDLDLNQLSYLVSRAFGEKNTDATQPHKRMYPSGGGRYSIEVYMYVNSEKVLRKGFYHYNVKEHSLEKLDIIHSDEFNLSHISSYDWVRDCKYLFFLTSVFDRSFRKYGDRGYRYILLEAGHIGQNVCLLTTELGLSTVGLGGVNDVEVEKLLGIDGTEESLVYALSVM